MLTVLGEGAPVVGDHPGIDTAIAGGSLNVTHPDWYMHLGCCATKKQAEAARIVIAEEFGVVSAAKMLGVSKQAIYARVKAFLRKVDKHERRIP